MSDDRFLGEPNVFNTLEEALEARRRRLEQREEVRARSHASIREGQELMRKLRVRHVREQAREREDEFHPELDPAHESEGARRNMARLKARIESHLNSAFPATPRPFGACEVCGGSGSIPVYGSGQANDCPACGPKY